MSMREKIQTAMKEAMKSKDSFRLECLRMLKGAILLKEKESAKEPSEEECVAALRAEAKKRRDSIDVFRQVGKTDEAQAAEAEIAIIEEFLPRQLSSEELEAKVKDYLAAHPEMNHAGKLTGALKKELGDLADGKMLSDTCKKALEG